MDLTVNIYSTHVEILDEEKEVVIQGSTPVHFYIAQLLKDLNHENNMERQK